MPPNGDNQDREISVNRWISWKGGLIILLALAVVLVVVLQIVSTSRGLPGHRGKVASKLADLDASQNEVAEWIQKRLADLRRQILGKQKNSSVTNRTYQLSDSVEYCNGLRSVIGIAIEAGIGEAKAIERIKSSLKTNGGVRRAGTGTRDLLTILGVGRCKVFYNDRTDYLWVRAPEKELRTIDDAIRIVIDEGKRLEKRQADE